MTPEELKAWRSKKKVSQEALARFLSGIAGQSISTTNVYRWEAGRVKVPHWVPLYLTQFSTKKGRA